LHKSAMFCFGALRGNSRIAPNPEKTYMRTSVQTGLTLLAVFLSGCSARDKNDKGVDSPSKGESSQLKVTDFDSFIGFKYGDRLKDVNSVFGNPIHVRDDSQNDFVSNCFINYVEFRICPLDVMSQRKNDTISHITVLLEGKEKIIQAGRNDRRLQLLGMSRIAVLDLLGTSEEQDGIVYTSGSSWLQYSYQSHGQTQGLWVFCPESGFCDQIRVFWRGTNNL